MNNNETLNQAQAIQSLKSTEVIRNDYVRGQFISVYNAIWKEGGEAAYEREAMYFNNQLRDNERLRACTGMSVFFAFIDLAVRGLTLEPGSQSLCYLLPRNYCVGKNPQGSNVYEARCNLTISGYGELVLRAKAGQILHADNPVVVYEGDEFAFGEKEGRKYVNYCCRIPRSSNRIIACFLKITRPDGTVDYSVMTEADWKRLSDFSGKANRYWDNTEKRYVENPNQLYTSCDGQIDIGFLLSLISPNSHREGHAARKRRGHGPAARLRPVRGNGKRNATAPAGGRKDIRPGTRHVRRGDDRPGCKRE